MTKHDLVGVVSMVSILIHHGGAAHIIFTFPTQHSLHPFILMSAHRNPKEGFRSMPTDTEMPIPRDKGSCPRRLVLRWTHLVLIVVGSILVGVVLTIQFRCNDEESSNSTLKKNPILNVNGTLTTSEKLNVEMKIPEVLVDDGRWPKIAWLMSFPNSGTSFTSKMIRHLSHMSTASNYGEEVLDKDGKSVPIFDSNGPFWIEPPTHPEYTRPSLFALTKTHCGGRCEKCGPSKFVENPHSFLTACLSGKIAHTTPDGKVVKKPVTYSLDLVQRAVHLIRSPFDNVVSRFHLELHEAVNHNDTEKIKAYPNTRDGFRKFCQRLNKVYEHEEETSRFIGSHVFELMKDIPCRDDFLRFVQWHNLAFVTTDSLRIPTMVVHYENYEKKYNETAMEMAKFLHFDPIGELVEFVKGKEYIEYFTPAEQEKVTAAIKILALSSTWDQISHYFE